MYSSERFQFLYKMYDAIVCERHTEPNGPYTFLICHFWLCRGWHHICQIDLTARISQITCLIVGTKSFFWHFFWCLWRVSSIFIPFWMAICSFISVQWCQACKQATTPTKLTRIFNLFLSYLGCLKLKSKEEKRYKKETDIEPLQTNLRMLLLCLKSATKKIQKEI